MSASSFASALEVRTFNVRVKAARISGSELFGIHLRTGVTSPACSAARAAANTGPSMVSQWALRGGTAVSATIPKKATAFITRRVILEISPETIVGWRHQMLHDPHQFSADILCGGRFRQPGVQYREWRPSAGRCE